jgi:hypothetical protein
VGHGYNLVPWTDTGQHQGDVESAGPGVHCDRVPDLAEVDEGAFESLNLGSADKSAAAENPLDRSHHLGLDEAVLRAQVDQGYRIGGEA